MSKSLQTSQLISTAQVLEFSRSSNTNTASASDTVSTIAPAALTIFYSSGVDTSTTTRTVGVTTPVAISSTGSGTITLAIAEDAYLGDAEFTVSVDGVQIGGVQTATALHADGQNQLFTLSGNFGAGTHQVSVDFLNDAVALYTNGTTAGDRNLYVDSIDVDGVTTIENSFQNLPGTVNYSVTIAPTVGVPLPLAPIVTVNAAASASATSTATLGTVIAGDSGDTLAVKLISDADFTTGSSLALTNGTLVYTPGAITAANVGPDTITYTVTDNINKLVTTKTQNVTLVAPVIGPAIAITSQVLTQDTGSSATDNITNMGAVTLTGTVAGATGTVISIVDGAKLLGAASILNGTWSYTTTLAAGTHMLHAVATDPSGNTVTTVAEPAITVDLTAPVLTIAAPVQVANTTAVTLTGTVADAEATTVQVKDGSTVLGTATVSNDSWSYTSGNLASGDHNFSAVATDLAGNTASASDAVSTIAPALPTAPPDIVVASVSTGSSETSEQIDLSSATRIVGTYVPTSTSGIGTNPLVLYNWNPSTQLQGFLAAQAAGNASIVGIGDSWTSGFGSATSGWTQLSYLGEMSQALTQDGIAAQSDNFLGSEYYVSNDEVDDNRITPIGYSNGGANYDGGFAIDAGGDTILLNGIGKGFSFELNTPSDYNEVTLSYIDVGNGSVSLTVDGAAVGTMIFGNTGQTLTQTIKIPAGTHSDLVVASTSANPVYIQGAAFSSTANPAIQVYNAGIGGWDSSSADISTYMGSNIKGSGNGNGETAGAAALRPSLALIDLGSNDIALSEDTTAQTLANIEQIVATLQAAGTDVIIMIPQPFGSTTYATELPALRVGLEAYSTANNVPLIDLSATYDNSEVDLEAAGLKADLLHGNATLYADIGSQLAQLLTQTIANASTGSTANIAEATVSDLIKPSDGTQPVGEDFILSPEATTLTGTAGDDTISATTAALNKTVQVDGAGGTNTLSLVGGGSFDLAAPEQLNNIQVVSATESPLTVANGTSSVQTVYLRNGLNVTVNVASDTADADKTNGPTISIYGAADSSIINLGSGTDFVTLGSSTETVNASSTGIAMIQGTAAEASSMILGNGQSSTRLEITSGGNAHLNSMDADLTVKLDGPTNLTLSPMQFITADGSVGGSTITALANNQTLLGGVGDTLVGSVGFGDIFKGSAALMNNDIIKNFGGSDQIDLTDVFSANISGSSWTANSTGGVLQITYGHHSTSIDLLGAYSTNSFAINADGATGTSITFK